jgi:hypothetical protein
MQAEHGVWDARGSLSQRRDCLVYSMGAIYTVFNLTDMSPPRREGEGRMHEDEQRQRWIRRTWAENLAENLAANFKGCLYLLSFQRFAQRRLSPQPKCAMKIG